MTINLHLCDINDLRWRGCEFLAHRPNHAGKLSQFFISIWYIRSFITLQQILHQHQVNKISFISKDAADNRSFSYIVGGDGDGKHTLFGVKTDKPVGR